MPTNNVMTLTELADGLARFTKAERDEAEEDVLVPTPQEQSAARKRELLRRARELGIYVDRASGMGEIESTIRRTLHARERQDAMTDLQVPPQDEPF